MDNKYNYVFYNFFEDYYEPVVGPLRSFPLVRVYDHAFDAGPIVKKLFVLHWSAKFNKKIKLPLKKMWFSKMFRKDFGNNKPCCYVFLTGKYILEDSRIYDYIKSINPDNKVVILCGDLISKKKWDIDKIKSMCDMIVTYDKGEAEKYGVEYEPWTNNYNAIEDVTMPGEFENDVYFLGFAKDRLSEIHSAYKVFADAGLKCKFIICGTSEEDRLKGDGLYYIPPISYRENIKNVQKSRCLLEIIQGGSCAPTLRFREACEYKRKLITNNENPEYSEQMSKDNLLVYRKPEDISTRFAQEPIDYTAYLSTDENPMGIVAFLEKVL